MSNAPSPYDTHFYFYCYPYIKSRVREHNLTQFVRDLNNNFRAGCKQWRLFKMCAHYPNSRKIENLLLPKSTLGSRYFLKRARHIFFYSCKCVYFGSINKKNKSLLILGTQKLKFCSTKYLPVVLINIV